MPATRLYVPKKRITLNQDFISSLTYCVSNGFAMQSINEYRLFLRHLINNPNGTKDATGDEIMQLQMEILYPTDEPWNEYLDSRFHIIDNWAMIQHKTRLVNNQIYSVTETLESFKKGTHIKIKFSEWLNRANKHGLPYPDISQGDLMSYSSPSDGSLSMIQNQDGRIYLGLSWIYNFSENNYFRPCIINKP